MFFRLAFVLALLGGCKAESPEVPINLKPDATTVTQLKAPRIASDVPVMTPLTSLALRGRADGTMVVVKGGASGDVVKPPLPSGDFCVDVPLAPGATLNLNVTSLGNGLISPASQHTITQEANSSPPPSPYCEQPPCQGGPCPTTETECADGKDNDFDGWTDVCDLECNGCKDDFYAPNSYPANVPTLQPGSYDLKICPCHDDWFAFHLSPGGHVDVKATFTASAINIDMKLFRADDAENGKYKTSTPLKYSTSTLSSESIYYTTTKTEDVYLWIYSAVPKKTGTYRLTVL